MKALKVLFSMILSVSVLITSACSELDVSTVTDESAVTGELSVHFIDVGQGDATYIKTATGENIVIDAGNKGKGDTVVEYLKTQNVNTIDVLISTHPDADHVGGLDEVVNSFPVKNVYAPKVSHTTQAYKDFLTAVKKQNVKIKTAKAGVELPLEGVKARFVGPTKEYSKSDLNNYSAVLHMTYKNNTFLFTGDAETRAEMDMLDANTLSKVDVLKVSHHGALEATNEEFLNVTRPSYGIISVGDNNRYGHPTSETLARLKKSGVKTYRTDELGTIVVTSDGTNILVK